MANIAGKDRCSRLDGKRMSFVPVAYAPVWFSSDRQMTALLQSFASATMTSKLLGRFKVPDDSPYLQHVLMPWHRLPIVLQAQGVVDLGETSLTFRPKPYRLLGHRVRNTLKDLSFDLHPTDVNAIEPADFRSPVSRILDLPFTRIRTSRPSPIDNFLLCVGGKIALPRIQSRSLELQNNLLAWHAVSSQAAM
jgi:hypothetical protein